MKFFKKKISPLYSLLILTVSVGFFACSTLLRSSLTPEHVVAAPVTSQSTPVTNYRMHGFAFAHPLLLTDNYSESMDLQSLKSDIALFIDAKKNSGEITSAAVHVVSLNDGAWMAINDGEPFNPGSLFKVSVLMTYLREQEKHPGVLDKKLFLSPERKVPQQTFTEKYIVPGNSYSIRELLYHMIVKSDNYATLLLNENVNAEEFGRFYNEIGLPTPNMQDRNYSLTVTEYSKIFRVLYNASYLSNEDADYALSLLVQGSFKEGLLKQLPPDVIVAHKFGEWGEPAAGSLHQLHEAGIVYLGNNPYLVNVMTKGKEVKALPDVIANISKMVYDRMSARQRS